MSCGRIVVLGLALSAFALRLTLREYLLTRLLPRFGVPDDDVPFAETLPNCTPESVTTTSYHDLRVTVNDTAVQAASIARKHGVAFLEDLLPPTAAKDLRDYILRENTNPSREDWFVLSGTNRKHLTFGLREDPVVTSAIQTILSSDHLQGALRGLFGTSNMHDVALMELASITSMHGAEGQRWHKDVNPNGRNVDMYSLFIPLQDTVEDQGPTGLCAGTHTCREEKLNCDKWGKTIKATTTAGTGALMNAQLYHRGSKHLLEPAAGETTDTTARVMFYMTFAEAPTARPREYKRPPKGATYALRPHLWGMTAQQVLDGTLSSWFSWWWWPWTVGANWGFMMGDNSLLGPKHRGWTQWEMACVMWANGSDYADMSREDVETIADWCTRVAVALLVLYTLIAEMDFIFLARQMRRLPEGQIFNTTPDRKTTLLSKAKVA
uniref:Uncharacterized protein n=1 Tax=Amphora coffeiformis TaxID=265554 RepID=A0A7S3LCF2_9STRA|mmetsp:Transcript_5531/g.10763  ORF Transcript_5531/g.10763 Transcript_5531/m.10763 type:complete len:438 (+) Transcript_5531:89-1402(+)